MLGHLVRPQTQLLWMEPLLVVLRETALKYVMLHLVFSLAECSLLRVVQKQPHSAPLYNILTQ
jgi:hypothetical protein